MKMISLKTFFIYPWERLAFFFFIFTLPFSLRNVLWDFSPTGNFNEYTDISIYLSDITLLAFVILIIIKHNILRKSTDLKMFHVEQVYYALPFLIWLFSTILWAENKLLSFYASMKLLEGYFLIASLLLFKGMDESAKMFHVEHKNAFLINYIQKCSTWNIWQWVCGSMIISGLFQALVALSQFFFQKSIGWYVLGESRIAADLPGIAKIVIGDEMVVRSYGLFPHPNILAEFLSITLFISFIYPLFIQRRMFHVEQSKYLLALKIIILIQFLALISTFSKSAFAGLGISFCYLIYSLLRNVPRGTISRWKQKMFHVEHLTIPIFVVLLITGLFQWINSYFFVTQPVQERLFFYSSIHNLSFLELLFGLGNGQFVLFLQNLYSFPLEIWQFQPIHNVFLLILAEGGVIGLSLLLFMLMGFLKLQIHSMFHVEHDESIVPRRTNIERPIAYSFMILILIPALTDHYWWDIQQGQLLFWLAFGIIYLLLTTRK